MRKAEIDALVRAHGGRARPVAFFHVLRQPSLSQDDHAFLLEHADELGVSDLLRFRSRCEPGKTGHVIRHLAGRAIADPSYFQHEVLDLPRIELDDHEWRELADLVRGKVPEALHAGIVARGGARPERPPPSFYFTPGKLDRTGLDPGGDPDATPSDEDVARGASALTLRQIVIARDAGRFAIDDQALSELAMERARGSDEDWSRATELPALLKEAVLARARRTPRSAERANLLAWLEAKEVPRATLFPIALAASDEKHVSYGLVVWLARQLATRAAWDKHGLETMNALMARRAFPEIGEIITQVYGEADTRSAERAKALLEAISVALALALIDLVRASLDVGETAHAAAALSALACLDPPSRVSRPVHELRGVATKNAELVELVALNERLVKHSDARDASLEGVVAALHAIADAFN